MYSANLETEISFGASIKIKKSAAENMSADFVLESLKVKKCINKNIKIKEHSPSYWHNC